MRKPPLTVADLALLAMMYPAESLEPIGDKNSRKKHSNKSHVYNVYPVDALPRLLDVVRANQEKVRTRIRYLLTTGGQLLLAQEGSTPPHQAMTGEAAGSSFCWTAGNLLFDENLREITAINNKSGDFQPHDASLQRVLPLLLHLHANHRIRLSHSLMIHHVAGLTKQSVMVPLDVLGHFFHHQTVAAQAFYDRANQPSNMIEYTYRGGARVEDDEVSQEASGSSAVGSPRSYGGGVRLFVTTSPAGTPSKRVAFTEGANAFSPQRISFE